MIGAMPAVAVRHERRKQEKRSKRPSQLYLGGYGLKHPSPPSRGPSPSPSPLQSPPTQNDDTSQEFYVCGKVRENPSHDAFRCVDEGSDTLFTKLTQLLTRSVNFTQCVSFRNYCLKISNVVKKGEDTHAHTRFLSSVPSVYDISNYM
jgi:hypothetical protein